MADVDLLVERARIVRAIRAFFDGRGFVEVETAVRIPAPAPEEHIDCPPCCDGGYLRASPELQMKKLLAAGMDRIYQLGPCFREGERGSRHSPEFTMLEWYRRGATYRDIADDLMSLLERLGEEACRRGDANGSSPSRPSRLSRRLAQTSVLSVREAYLRFAGWDPWAGGGGWDQDRFDFDMATKIEPAVKELGGGVFLVDYPPQVASLAKTSTAPGGLSPMVCAERWEFYWDGLELANCFTELCDEEEQRTRFAAAKAARAALGESDYPIDEDFLSSLPRIGSAAGVALGVDRLVMKLTGATDIASVRAPV